MRNADNIVINPSAGAIAVAAGSSETIRVTNDYFSGFPERFATDSSARLTLLQQGAQRVQRNCKSRKSITPHTFQVYRIFEPIPAGGCPKAAISLVKTAGKV